MVSSTCFASFRRFPPVRNFSWIQLAASNVSSQLIETISPSNRRRWHRRGIWPDKIFRRSLCDQHHCRLRSKGRNMLWRVRRRSSSCSGSNQSCKSWKSSDGDFSAAKSTILFFWFFFRIVWLHRRTHEELAASVMAALSYHGRSPSANIRARLDTVLRT